MTSRFHISGGVSRAHARESSGMSLIELMVVMLIIGILVGMVSAMVFSVLRNSKIRRAESEVRAIALAAEEYYRVFRELPVATNWYHTSNPPDGERSDCFFAPGVWASTMPPTGGSPYQSTNRPSNTAMAREFYDRLTGMNGLSQDFLKITRTPENSSNGVLLDPWKTPYDFYFDSNFSGELHFYNYGGGVVETWLRQDRMFFVRSRGPDRQVAPYDRTSSDDITWPTCDSIAWRP
jgi:prepilin-type N-terminal cleavage/methylation domain-containing protein